MRRDAAGRDVAAGAGVRVFSFAGERAERIAATTTDGDGAFELTEDLADEAARGRGARDRGVVAEHDGDPSCSYPAFVSVETPSGATPTPPHVTLTLRPGILVRGRLVDGSGRRVPHGQGVVRWLLPPGAHVEGPDIGGAAPRHAVIDADGEGRFELILPAGHVQLRGRRGPAGGLGAAVEADVGPDPRPPPLDVGVGADDARVRLRVTARDGTPIPAAMGMLRAADVLYAVTSPALDRRDVGAIFGDATGTICIDGVALDNPPFVVGVGAPGYIPTSIVLSPTEPGPRSVVLDPKPLAIGTVRAPDGSVVEHLDVAWELVPAGLEEGGAARPMARSDDVVARIEEQLPAVEEARDSTSGGWRFRVTTTGRYDVVARVEGLPPLRSTVELTGPTPRFAVSLPPGRPITLRAELPDEPALAGYAWRLSVTGAAAEATPPRPLASEVALWRPTPAAPELRLWCPDGVVSLLVGPSSPIDLPVEPTEVRAPPVPGGVVPVPIRSGAFATLEMQDESPPGTPRPGVEMEVLSAGIATPDRRRGIRRARTDDAGLARLVLPPGAYLVRRSRSDGPPQWTRVQVAAGGPTRVLIPR